MTWIRSILAMTLIWGLTIGSSQSQEIGQDRIIRVLISENQSAVKLTVLGNYQIYDFEDKSQRSSSRRLMGVKVRANTDHLLIAGVRFPKSVQIFSSDERDLYINDQPFRGSIVIHLLSNNTLQVINYIDVEDYLYGVLFHEVGAWWPMSALKAQAVASRTYALYEKSVKKNKTFDVFNNQSSQMYGGADSERSRSNQAVNETRGEVLTYDGKIFPTFYHATCGGLTRDASELWNIDIPPLDGNIKCQHCWFSPHFSWDAKFSLHEVQKVLEQHRAWVGQINDLQVDSRALSERVLTILLKGPYGQKEINAKDFRLWLGPTVIRSENFEITTDRDKVLFAGKGWGHGVGMCQWGALGLSIMRRDYREILGFYYPYGEIVKNYE